jgi:hypothetical protein
MEWLNHNGVAVQAVSTAILVLVTAFYAIQTWLTVKRMREQMYNTVLPKIDIVYRRITLQDSCYEPINVGAGAAIDVISFYIESSGKRIKFSFYETISPNEHLAESEKLKKGIVCLVYPSTQQEQKNLKVVAVYSDIYGRHFESSREIHGDSKLGPLNTRCIKDKEWREILAASKIDGE